MRFEEKLKNRSSQQIWQEYCGFLDLDLDGYMNIQNRLMAEQVSLWKASKMGRKIMEKNGIKEEDLETVDDFRKLFPVTTYDDYADILLQKNGDMLPADPVIWIQTTWEGGMHPIKVAPYTRSMLDTYKRNAMACMILGVCDEKGKINVRPDDNFLYGLAALPYATGLLPRALEDEMKVNFLPPVREAESLSFKERNKKGFKMGLKSGIDYFFGMGSVAYFVSKSLSALSGSSGGGGRMAISPKIALRYLRAKKICRRENRELMPKDLFTLKGIMVAGTDCGCYKDELEEMWGIRPMELFAGTEPTCIGTETWTREGMYFFPDACFYEFIPEDEMLRCSEDTGYQPRTCLMDEVVKGEKYEIVLSVLKGGAFMRYRVGDVYRCAGLENSKDGTRIPRFYYIDRVPDIIDIAGFTRITERSVENVVKLSGLAIEDWTVIKEYTENNKPVMRMYVEMKPECLMNAAVSRTVIKEHLTIYFKYMDQDYEDLKKILGMDPLDVNILRCGTFEYYNRHHRKLRKINPSSHEVRELVSAQEHVVSRTALI